MEKLFLYFAYFFTCILFSSCDNDTVGKKENEKAAYNNIKDHNEVKQDNHVIISGVIREPRQKWITILQNDVITGKKSHTERIDESGKFQFSFDLAYSQDLYVMYNHILNSIFCSPGDSLQLFFNGKRYIDSLTFKGKNAKANVQLHSFLEGIDFNQLHYLRSNNNLTQSKFRDLAELYESKCQSLISKINPGKEMAAWMDTYTRFLFAEIRYEYAKKNNIDTEDNYFEFLTELDSLGWDIKSCTEAFDFIQQYYNYQLEKEDLDKSLQLAYNNDDYFTYSSKNIAFVLENPTHINQVALAAILYTVVDLDYQIIDSLFTEYSNVVQHEYFKQIIKNRINYHKLNMANSSSQTTLDSLSNDEFVGELFKEIKEKNRGKIIYFDFWGTSCKYCIEEFPSSVMLYKELEGKDIEFIYFCAPAETKRQQDIILRYNLKGHHYMLTRDQLKKLNSHFGFSALPRYMITDKQGKFIDTNAKKPSSKKIKQELFALADE